MPASSEREFVITAADGTSLLAWVAVPSEPSAVLLLCHGLGRDGGQSGLFTRLRDHALSAGLAVVRFDFRAHGRSGGAQRDFRLAGLRLDASAALELTTQSLGAEIPVIPLGFSFGGGPAVHIASTSPSCRALVLWAAVIDYESTYGESSSVPFTLQMRAARSQIEIPEWADFPVLGTDFHMPQAVIREIRDDPTPETVRTLTMPILIYHGTGDHIVDIGPARRVAAENPAVTLRAMPKVRHEFGKVQWLLVRRTVQWAVAASKA